MCPKCFDTGRYMDVVKWSDGLGMAATRCGCTVALAREDAMDILFAAKREAEAESGYNGEACQKILRIVHAFAQSSRGVMEYAV